MRILQINTVSGYGSTGSIVVDIATELGKQGHECFIAFGQMTSPIKNSYKIGSRFENNLHNLLSRLFGNQGYYSKKGTRSLIKYIKKIKPQVIHLHNLHGNYLNLKLLFSFLSYANIPVVWTLHDCWPFTGKCTHYTSVNCNKWQSLCNECPLVHAYPSSIFFDRSREMYLDKQNWFNSIKNLTLVPVSRWLQNEISRSFLKSHKVNQIYNWVDQSIFHPSVSEVRNEYKIPTEKKIFICVGAAWSEQSIKFQDAKKFANCLDEDSRLILVGNLTRGTNIPKKILHIPYLNSAHQLARLYSIADAYIHFSREDTFGKVIVEAMACGTPVIVYNATACPEVVGDECGFIISSGNMDQMKMAIKKLPEISGVEFSEKRINYVKENYDYLTNIKKYIELFNSLIE